MSTLIGIFYGGAIIAFVNSLITLVSEQKVTIGALYVLGLAIFFAIVGLALNLIAFSSDEPDKEKTEKKGD